MDEFDYDAVIVGAGPIGGYLAQKLAKNNIFIAKMIVFVILNSMISISKISYKLIFIICILES